MPKLGTLQDKEVPLTGKRISVMQMNSGGELASAERPISLPSQRQNADWTQPGGTPNNAPGHLALGQAVKNSWSADAGAGSSFWGKLTSSPIVYANKVFTLDAYGQVSAFSLSDGSTSWRVSTTPPNEKDREGFGGGFRAGGVSTRLPVSAWWWRSTLAAARSCGKSVRHRYAPPRLPPASVCSWSPWRERRSAYRDRTALSLDLPRTERASIQATSPAVEGDIAIFPYPTGDVRPCVPPRVSRCGRSRWRAPARARRCRR